MKSTMLESQGIKIILSFGGKVRVNPNDKEVE